MPHALRLTAGASCRRCWRGSSPRSLRVARRWAIPGALVAATVVIAVDGGPVATDRAAPSLVFVTPVLDLQAIAGIALPLFVVTMASQNLTGLTVLRSVGYHVETRPMLVTMGGLTVAGA